MTNRHITFKINIPIPNWCPTKPDIMFWYRTQKYKLFPFRCNSCNTKLDFKHPIYRVSNNYGPIPYHSMLVQSPEQLCSQCFAMYVTRYFKSHKQSMITDTCDCCNTITEVTDHIKHYGTLGHGSWNGANLCLSCITTVITQGMQESSHILAKSGVHYFINEAGAIVSKK